MQVAVSLGGGGGEMYNVLLLPFRVKDIVNYLSPNFIRNKILEIS